MTEKSAEERLAEIHRNSQQWANLTRFSALGCFGLFMVVLIGGAIATLSMCSFNGPAARLSVEEDTAIFAAEADVKSLLRDPDSAIFSSVRVARSGAVCGQVNSRNGLGGMSGQRRFIRDRQVRIEGELGDPEFSIAWATQCAE